MILTSIERILKETLNNVEQSLAENIIKQASFELTNSKVYFYCDSQNVGRQSHGSCVSPRHFSVLGSATRMANCSK